jgi:hypothetical protein
MRKLPYAGRDGFQLKIFYIPEKQCAYIQRKVFVQRMPFISTAPATMRLASPTLISGPKPPFFAVRITKESCLCLNLAATVDRRTQMPKDRGIHGLHGRIPCPVNFPLSR